MRSNKGITLVSVIIYVIVMLIIVTLISIITGYFFKNVNINNETYDTSLQYTRFNSYFSEEINRKNNKIIEFGETESNAGEEKQQYVVFSSGNQYTYVKENKAIYMNQVKIAGNIQECTFQRKIVNGRDTINVNLKIGEDKISMDTTYTLNN